MKAEKLKNHVIEALEENPRIFDHVNTKNVKTILLEKYNFNASEALIIKVMMELTRGEGYDCSDGSTLTWADENGVAGSKMTGLHKYWWFNL